MFGYVRFGHIAVVQQPITQRTAFGGIAEVNNAQNHDSKGPQSANEGGQCSDLLGVIELECLVRQSKTNSRRQACMKTKESPKHIPRYT